MSMFCFQCEQTVGGKGCTKFGVCGKDPEVAGLQDLLIYQLKGIGFYGNELLAQGKEVPEGARDFVFEGLFATLTNVNFDHERFAKLLRTSQEVKDELKELSGITDQVPEAASFVLSESREELQAVASKVGIKADGLPEDLLSLREMLVYGLKGMAAYAHHAKVLGYEDQRIANFTIRALAALTDLDKSAEELLDLLMELGRTNYLCMELLDKANTGTYGNPEPTEVYCGKKKGPFIIVSGHDLKDLRQLLEQTEGKGINIYTHGEMLPAHGYPELKKFKHLVGNYGSAWQNQQKEFDNIPGCVLMTTNCIQRPRPSYRDRIFTTGPVGWPDVAHIEEKDGKKDFTPVIKKALELGGWEKDEQEGTTTVGFGHAATLSHAGAIIDAVKGGKIRHFFLVGGCDGARPGRSYYTELAEAIPEDCVILTLACGKYRFNMKEFGTVAGLPRLLDVGQCNDAYSAIRIATALAEAFECGINELPLTLVLSWYEQKAVAILLTLLALGVKNIYLGPSLPAFASENVLSILVEKFGLRPISTPEEDLAAILK
ncbi:MAG TPA: hydroxylamine reductase [Bacillota bacterium]|nr:hydroxylamine reductase [Bacillota bacterium]